MYIKNSNKQPLHFRDILTIVKDVFAILSFIGVVVAFLSYGRNFIPFLIPNTMQRAQAGDQKAQVEIADRYYDMGDFANSFYWYTEASFIADEYRGIAYNNIAVLYYHNLVPENFNTANPYYYDTILDVLEKAIDYGSEEAQKNRVNFLRVTEHSQFRRARSLNALKGIEQLENYTYLRSIPESERGTWKSYPFLLVNPSQYIYTSDRYIMAASRDYDVYLSNEWATPYREEFDTWQKDSDDIIYMYISSRNVPNATKTSVTMKTYYTYDVYEKLDITRSNANPNESTYDIIYEKPRWVD